MGSGFKKRVICIIIALFIALPGIAQAADSYKKPYSRHHVPPGVFVELTDNFYKALKNDQSLHNRVYTNRVTDEYLRQIAVSTRFMVETNLKIIEQQEKIIELLEKGRGKY